MAKGPKMLIKASVRDSIAQLLEEAKLAHKNGKKAWETRYLKMALMLVKKHKIRLNKDQKNKFCKKCLTWFEPGQNVKLIYDQKHHLIRMMCECGARRTI